MEDVRRQKATQESHPGIGPATIEVAYRELTQEGFAAWMRLMIATDVELAAGRAKFAEMLRYKERRSNEVLRELHLKGYIAFDSQRGRLTKIIIRRRAAISARANFVRFSSLLASAGVEAQPTVRFTHFSRPTDRVAVGLTWPSVGLTHTVSRTYLGGESDFPTQAQVDAHIAWLDASIGVDAATALASILEEPNLDLDEGGERRKYVAPGTYLPPLATGAKRGSIDLSRMKSGKERLKDQRHVERSETAERRVTAAKVRGTPVGSINWIALDKYDDPIMTWDPASKMHGPFITILDRPKNDKARTQLVDKITTEFCRIYTRYRREAERRRRAYSDYNVPNEERRYAADAGIMCLRKGVTPRQLLEYWDAHIGNFADRTMYLPPLSFLKAPANIDRVACSVLPSAAPPAGARAGGGRPAPATAKPAGGHSYANTDGLDPRLRTTLQDGGFKTQMYNDRFLLTVQHNALLLAKGQGVYMADGPLKKMAEHAATVLYAE